MSEATYTQQTNKPSPETYPALYLACTVIFMGLKRPELDVNYLPASSTEMKNEWSYTSTLLYTPSWRRQRQILTIRFHANKFMKQSRSWTANIAVGDKWDS